MNERYFKEEYIAAHGKHFNEPLAKMVVGSMWHDDADGKRIAGEAVGFNDAQTLLQGLEAKKIDKMQWDAYVAANAFMHDLADSGLSNVDIMSAARCFWFHDDDMDEGCHKVFWYFFG